MLSGWIWKTLVVLGAAALGVEYGRRHPDEPWSDLARLLQQRAIDVRDAVRRRRTKPVEPVAWPPPGAAPAETGPVSATAGDTMPPAGPDLGPLA